MAWSNVRLDGVHLRIDGYLIDFGDFRQFLTQKLSAAVRTRQQDALTDHSFCQISGQGFGTIGRRH